MVNHSSTITALERKDRKWAVSCRGLEVVHLERLLWRWDTICWKEEAEGIQIVSRPFMVLPVVPLRLSKRRRRKNHMVAIT